MSVMDDMITEDDTIENFDKKLMTVDDFKKEQEVICTQYQISEDQYYNNKLLEYKEILYSDHIEYIPRSQEIIILPQYWKDYIMTFCLALDIIKKHYENNSLILSLGESPCKLVFTQSLFYSNQITNELISQREDIPKNLTFQYLPLSSIVSNRMFKKYIDGYDYPIVMFKEDVNVNDIYNSIKISENILDIYLQHFINHKLDPKNIINNTKDKFITIDRVETYKSICVYIFIYFSMAQKQNLTYQEKIILMNKFKIVGFDGSYNTPETTAQYNKNAKKFIAIVLQENLKIDSIIASIYSEQMFYFYTIPTSEIILNEVIDNYIKSLSLLKSNNISVYDLLIKYFFRNNYHHYINFISLPEHVKRNSRCIRSIKINDMTNIEDYNHLHKYYEHNKYDNVKEDEASSNCNIINLIYYIVLNKLAHSDIISKLFNNELNMTNISLIQYNYEKVADIIKRIQSMEKSDIIKLTNKNLFDLIKEDPLLNTYSIFNIGFVPSYNQIIGSESITSAISATSLSTMTSTSLSDDIAHRTFANSSSNTFTNSSASLFVIPVTSPSASLSIMPVASSSASPSKIKGIKRTLQNTSESVLGVDSKIPHIDEEKLFLKYLKYKNKYLKLKNKMII